MTIHSYPNDSGIWEDQPDALKEEASPTTGTKYTVLETTKNCRVISMAARCTFDACDPLEIHVTIDGKSMIFTSSAAVSGTWLYSVPDEDAAITNQKLASTMYAMYKSHCLEGRSIKIEVEATGTNLSNLHCRVKYATR